MRLKKIFIGIGLLILSPLIAVFIRRTLLQVVGYDVDKEPKDLAEEIYNEGASVTRCIDLQWSLPTMGPTLDDQRSRCVFEYASIAKDPSACELLMPSSYGFSCVASATINMPCLLSDEETVVWNDGTYREIPYTNCTEETSEMGKACCSLAGAKFNKDFINCDSIMKENYRDQCWYEVARYKIDPALCLSVKNKNIADACSVRLDAILKTDIDQ